MFSVQGGDHPECGCRLLCTGERPLWVCLQITVRGGTATLSVFADYCARGSGHSGCVCRLLCTGERPLWVCLQITVRGGAATVSVIADYCARGNGHCECVCRLLCTGERPLWVCSQITVHRGAATVSVLADWRYKSWGCFLTFQAHSYWYVALYKWLEIATFCRLVELHRIGCTKRLVEHCTDCYRQTVVNITTKGVVR